MSKKLSYKEIHGKTRVGALLSKIGKSDLLDKVVGVGGSILSGNYLGAIKEIVGGDKSLGEDTKAEILRLAELDAKDMEETTSRWRLDMASDSWLSKNVRPILAISLVAICFIAMIIDSVFANVNVKEDWISLFSTITVSFITIYGGARAVEKINSMRRK